MPKKDYNYLQDPCVVGGGTVAFGPAALADPPTPKPQATANAAQPEPRRDRFAKTPAEVEQDRQDLAEAQTRLAEAKAENQRLKKTTLVNQYLNRVNYLTEHGMGKGDAYLRAASENPAGHRAWLKRVNDELKGRNR